MDNIRAVERRREPQTEILVDHATGDCSVVVGDASGSNKEGKGRQAAATAASTRVDGPSPPASLSWGRRCGLAALAVSGLGGLCSSVVADAVLMSSYADDMEDGSDNDGDGQRGSASNAPGVRGEGSNGGGGEGEGGQCALMRSGGRSEGPSLRKSNVVARHCRAAAALVFWAVVPHAFIWFLCVWVRGSLSAAGTPREALSTARQDHEESYPTWPATMLQLCFGLLCLCYVGTCRLGSRLFRPDDGATHTHTHTMDLPVYPPPPRRGLRHRSFFAHPLRRRTFAVGVGFFVLFCIATVHNTQYIFVYYDFQHGGRLAVTAWLIPAGVAAAVTFAPLLLVACQSAEQQQERVAKRQREAWRARRGAQSSRVGRRCRGGPWANEKECCHPLAAAAAVSPTYDAPVLVFVPWLAHWVSVEAAAAPSRKDASSTHPRASSTVLRLSPYLYAAFLVALLLLLASFLYYALVLAECLNFAALALSTPPSTTTTDHGTGWGSHPMARHPIPPDSFAEEGMAHRVLLPTAMAATPSAEAYPHSFLFHPMLLLSIWLGKGSGDDNGGGGDGGGGQSRGYTATHIALGGGPISFALTAPSLSVSYLYTQIALPIALLWVLRELLGMGWRLAHTLPCVRALRAAAWRRRRDAHAGPRAI